MTETQDVTTRKDKAVREAQEHDRAIRPAVDIFEDTTGITVFADIPGVSRDQLDISVDGDSLVIAGHVDIALPQGMNAVYADVRGNHYQRSFSLSRELDGDNISANLKNGVLTLRIPRRAEHRPRRIEVRAG